MWRRTTLLEPVIVSGKGLQTGCFGRVKIAPGRDGVRLGRPGRLRPLRVADVRAVSGGTLLKEGPATIEHLLAALMAVGLTDVDVTLVGLEVPALDGSARPWVDHLLSGGMSPLIGTLTMWQVTKRVVVVDYGGEAILEPSAGTEVEVSVEFGPDRGGTAFTSLPGIGPWCVARTFICAEDEQALRVSGRGLGATADNTVLWRTNDQAGLRISHEPVAHKLLDAIGDLACLGRPLLGRFWVCRGSHRLHLACLRAAMEQGALILVDGRSGSRSG